MVEVELKTARQVRLPIFSRVTNTPFLFVVSTRWVTQPSLV